MASSFRKVDPSQFKRCWQGISYASEDPRQVLDIYLPNEGDGPFPLIVFIHGGGWVSGDRRESTMPGVFKVMSQGYALACIEYRLAPEATWPEPLEDVRCAIRFLRAHANEYELKADKIAVWGNSAGAHLANMVAALAGRPMFSGRRLGYMEQSDAVQCVISLYSPLDMYQIALCDRTIDEDQQMATGGVAGQPGVPDDMNKPHNMLMGFNILRNPEAAVIASPMAFVSEDFPPALYMHGIEDQIVPYTQSVAMAKKVNYLCGDDRAKLRLFENAMHGAPSMKTDESVNEVLDFVDSVIWDGVHERTALPETIDFL